MEDQFISDLPLPQKLDACVRIPQQTVQQQDGDNPLAALESIQHQAYKSL